MAMVLASNNPLNHFADPHHPLRETHYTHDQADPCSICLLSLTGLRGYGCYSCNIHLHAGCAGHFQETINFFAHPWHNLKLRRSPGRVCDLCRGDCPQGSFVYSCVYCGFDVHSLCTMLPQRVANPYHEGHELRMVSSQSPGFCSACHYPLPMWRYKCSSVEELHIACAINPPPATATAPPASLGSSYNYAGAQIISSHHGAVGNRSFGGGGPGATQVTPGRVMTAIAKFLIKAAFNVAFSELASELLSGAFN